MLKNISISIFIVIFVIACTAEGAWDLLRSQADIFQALENYDNRIKVTISNSSQDEDLTNFPVLVILNTSRVTYGNISADGTGIKFISSDFSTELSYEIEEWNPGGDSFFWVKIPAITALSNTDYFWIYYSTESNLDSTNSESVWNNSYLAVWHMNDGGGTITDSSSSGLDGTINMMSGPVYEPIGKMAGAQYFDGSLDTINVTDATLLDNLGPVTFSFWMSDSGFTDLDYVLKKGGLIIRLWDPFSLRFRVSYDTNQVASQFDNTWDFLFWKFFSITWSGNSNHSDVSIFADGVILVSPDDFGNGGGSRISDAGTDFFIGSDESGNNSFTGRIDEMRISDVARTPEWIKAQYLSMTDNFLIYGPEENVSN